MSGQGAPRFRVSPSRLARFYFHECERYLRYSTATTAQRRDDGIPAFELDRSLVTKAILESGEHWELRILDEHLRERAVVAPGAGPRPQRRHSVEQTLDVLAHARPGAAIYQPTLHAPPSFYEAYGLDPGFVEFVDCYPDLLMVERDERGGRAVVVVDAKATDEMKLSHRIQTALWPMVSRIPSSCAGSHASCGPRA